MIYGYGFDITALMNAWAAQGVFSYVLPFLLVFAFVYGILANIKILGDNKGVNMIIAFAVGGLSLVGDFVPRFFQTIIPNLGMAISILLAAVILGGIFLGNTDADIRWIKYVIFGIGIIAFLVVLFSSLSDFNFVGSMFWYDYGSSLVVIALVIGAIVFAVVSGKK
jgi:MFS family permease